MIHGYVTYTDEALYMNKLSIATEDKVAARDTLNKVREFIKNNPTVYVSTHTPLGYMFAVFAAMFTILQNMTALHLKICRQIGNVRVANSRKINLTKRKFF